MEPTIEGGIIKGVKVNDYFNVKLDGGENPQINPTITLDGMPVDVMAKLCHEALKVRGRPAMKKLDVDTLKKTYKGEVSWRVLFNRQGGQNFVAQSTMSNEELDKEIERLKALQTKVDNDRLNPDELDELDELDESIDNIE